MIKVLVIDDDLSFLNIFATALQEQGFQAITSSTGSDGITQAKTQHPDIIFLDLILTDMPGLEVLRAIKKDETIAAVPIVMLTSFGNESIETEADTLGLAGYIHKYEMQVKDIGAYITNLLEKTKNSTPPIPPAAAQ